MAKVLDSVGLTETLLSVENQGVPKFSVLGNGSVQLVSGATTLDSSGQVREIYNPTAKTIVDGSATSLFSVAVAAGAAVGGVVHFSIFASDGTDHQTITGTATYGAVNKAATTTATVTYATANEAKAVSSGTLTLAFTAVDTTNSVTVKLQPTGSLTETSYTIIYSIFPLRGVVTIL